MLKEVKITKLDTCLTFAFKRIGHVSEIDDIADLEMNYELLDYLKYSKRLKKGDILIFTGNEETVFIPTEISQKGKIIYHNVLCKRHCVVYEGKGKVSDLTRGAVIGSSTPSLRIRLLNEISSTPKYLLRLK